MDNIKHLIALNEFKHSLKVIKSNIDEKKLLALKEDLLQEILSLFKETNDDFFELKALELKDIKINFRNNLLTRLFINLSSLKFDNTIFDNWHSEGKFLYFIQEIEILTDAIILHLKRHYY
ncbi:hypothetical protein L21SP5_00136 [Salinivirga cyanobacteriivorans]|uniref:Uncharacterized protein n=1 Tax=Salinivirga cyanobacteriivorans TaxID=1307839 RepID=A0A0S2HUZ4_9BACT|nr:hypothetical protein [Salinivirga cyanobacteriivorans]ALO13818.1 hypothetical protein L21SP5_00136 [Salinivirga cyanobacteriivorans]